MSIVKKFFPKKMVCRVTFKLDTSEMEDPKKVFLVGDFNDWGLEVTPMRRVKGGIFSASLELPLGTSYQFRYHIDGSWWENDDAADDYWPSPYGSDNSVVVIDDN